MAILFAKAKFNKAFLGRVKTFFGKLFQANNGGPYN